MQKTVVNVELGEYATSEDFRAAYTDVILPSVFVELAEYHYSNIVIKLLLFSWNDLINQWPTKFELYFTTQQ